MNEKNRRPMRPSRPAPAPVEEIEGQLEGRNALTEALRSGNLGVMDYYRMQNVLADTAMKNNVGNTDLTKMVKDKEENPTI